MTIAFDTEARPALAIHNTKSRRRGLLIAYPILFGKLEWKFFPPFLGEIPARGVLYQTSGQARVIGRLDVDLRGTVITRTEYHVHRPADGGGRTMYTSVW